MTWIKLKTESGIKKDELKLKGNESKVNKLIKLFIEEKNDEFFRNNNKIGKVFVPPSGNVDTKVVLIGEAPGKDEEKLKEPFVGKAGRNLNYVLDRIKLNRNELYITNIVKFRPFDNQKRNRKPSSKESSRGLFYLIQELEIVKPKLIVCLGATAGSTLLRRTISMEDSVGQIFSTGSYKLLVTYHPSPFNFNRKDLQQKIIGSFQLAKTLITLD